MKTLIGQEEKSLGDKKEPNYQTPTTVPYSQLHEIRPYIETTTLKVWLNSVLKVGQPPPPLSLIHLGKVNNICTNKIIFLSTFAFFHQLNFLFSSLS